MLFFNNVMTSIAEIMQDEENFDANVDLYTFKRFLWYTISSITVNSKLMSVHRIINKVQTAWLSSEKWEYACR